MLKFFRKKDSEIRRVAEVDEAGNKKMVAIIGQVDELITIGLLEPAPGMNDRAWVIIERQAVEENPDENFVELGLVEYDTLQEAKDECIEKWG
jgi:hypothetical protein